MAPSGSPMFLLGADLHARPLVNSASVIVVKKGHRLAKARKLEELAGATCLLSGPRLGPGDPVHLGFQSRGLASPQVTLQCESFSTLLALLPSMDTLALVPERFYDVHGPRMGLQALDLREKLPATTIHIFSRADTPLTLPMQRLLDTFMQAAESMG